MLSFAKCGTRLLATQTRNRPAFLCERRGRALSSFTVGRRRSRWSSIKRAVMVTEQALAEEEIDPGVIEGTDLRVLKYPHPLLRAPNDTVEIDGFNADLKQTAREMLKVMYASRGVGLAAPQVGVNKRLMVFNPDGDSKAFLKEVVMVNPEIVASAKKCEVEGEACLSFPGMNGKVQRPEWVKVEAYRLNGKKFKVKYEGWVARIFQHEYDHLQGVLYIDRLEEEDKETVKDRLAELVADYRANPYEGEEAAL